VVFWHIQLGGGSVPDDQFDGTGIEGQRVVITGGASGIGLAISRRFCALGARVAIIDLSLETLKAAAEADGRRLVTVQGDVADDPEGLTQAAAGELGGLDVLVNNAGIYPAGTMLKTGRELWERVIAVNLTATAYCARAAAALMIEGGDRGTIINISSIRAFAPSPRGVVAYDTSKAGVVGLTRSLALELAPRGIRVNAIAPGTIVTDGIRPILETGGRAAELAAAIPLGFLGDPDDIAAVAAFLAGRSARFVTGQIIAVDGGALLTSKV
jgi:NAD(P)-dependent dehydrogenase (short-subunit alcohol dehydrogenase family)